MNHRELVDRAEHWLRTTAHCGVVVRGGHSYDISRNSPDVLGWWNRRCTLIQCRTSRQGFDDKCQNQTIGDWRLFFTPPGLLNGLTIPAGWGWFEVYLGCVRHVIGRGDCAWQRSEAPLQSDPKGENKHLKDALWLAQQSVDIKYHKKKRVRSAKRCKKVDLKVWRPDAPAGDDAETPEEYSCKVLEDDGSEALEHYNSINGELISAPFGPLTLNIGDSLRHDGEVYRFIRHDQNRLALLRESDSCFVASAESPEAAITVRSIVQLARVVMQSDAGLDEVLGSWSVVHD